jgi:hypothetical protein
MVNAELATNPVAKQSFLELADKWRRIAESYEYIEEVERSRS